MNIIDTKEYEDNMTYEKKFTFDNTIQLNNLIPMLRNYENEKIKMLACHCSSFDEEGSVLNGTYNEIDELEAIKQYPNPSINFSIDFGDRETAMYRF